MPATQCKTILVAFALLSAASQEASSQNPPVAAQAPAARAADVASIDSILHALYDVISGPIGQRRNWDRMRSLFVPDARLIALAYPPNRASAMRTFTVQQYLDTVGPRLEAGGFFEREIARRTERFGGVVHAFSTYESRRNAADPAPFARGINSIQLWFDGQRWWVVTIYWEAERPVNPIPPVYLESADRGTLQAVRPAPAPPAPSDTSSAPLYVLAGDSIVTAINPRDIATVTVLKGGAAVADYGARARNGVVVITLVPPGARAP